MSSTNLAQRTGRRVPALALAMVVLGAMLTGVTSNPASATAVVPNTPVDLGVDVVLRPIATVPNSSFGVAPRLNAMASTGDRLFVVTERDGLVFELIGPTEGPRTTELFLDVGAAMAGAGTPLDTSSVFHGGLRSIAFHPAFETNGLIYASAMAARPSDAASHHYLSDVANPIGADSILLEFTADTSTGVVDPASIREVFRVGMPVYDHPIKQIAFDTSLEPDEAGFGLLYVGHGDGSVLSAIAGGGRNDDALGKILRIDPRATATTPYSVPVDNPFVGDPSMIDEVFSIGHRNPHSLAFASLPVVGGPEGQTERALIVAEAGRDNVEEINVIRAGGDYGWPLREGTFVHRPEGGVQTGIDPLPTDDAQQPFVYPAVQYGHGGSPGSQFTGQSVIGGFAVDNGSPLSGEYFFADFPTSGTLFHASLDSIASAITSLDPSDPTRDAPGDLTQAPLGLAQVFIDHDLDDMTAPLPRTSLRDIFDDASTYATTRADVRFGQGPNGELYITSKRNNLVYLVVNSVAPPEPDPVDPDPFDPDPVDPDPTDPGPTDPDPTDPDPTDPDPTDPEPTDPEPEPIEPSGPPPTIATATSVDELVASSDYVTADARILRLYRAFFDREPELDGARYWLDVSRGGRSLDSIARFFASSPEFIATYGETDDETFLRVVYANVLDRRFDQNGFDWWLDQMRDGMPRERVVLLFSDSPEFIGNYPYLPGR